LNIIEQAQRISNWSKF